MDDSIHVRFEGQRGPFDDAGAAGFLVFSLLREVLEPTSGCELLNTP